MNDSVKNLSEKQHEAQKVELIFPEQPMRYTCCAECPAGTYEADRGEVWCGHFRRYFPGSDGCSQGPNG